MKQNVYTFIQWEFYQIVYIIKIYQTQYKSQVEKGCWILKASRLRQIQLFESHDKSNDMN